MHLVVKNNTKTRLMIFHTDDFDDGFVHRSLIDPGQTIVIAHPRNARIGIADYKEAIKHKNGKKFIPEEYKEGG